jgi:hypothetical protein
VVQKKASGDDVERKNTKTVPARHGDNRETVEYMGESSGCVLRGEARPL